MIYTLIALSSIAAGIWNLVKFKEHIMASLTLRFFYYFSIACLLLTIVVCWLPISQWYEITWLLLQGIVHTLEMSYQWC